MIINSSCESFCHGFYLSLDFESYENWNKSLAQMSEDAILLYV